MTYEDMQDEPDPAFKEFQQMKAAILQLQRTVQILQNVAQQGINMQKQVDAMADHLRTLSRSSQFRTATAPSKLTMTDPDKPIKRDVISNAEIQSSGSGGNTIEGKRAIFRDAPAAPTPPPGYLVDVKIQDATPFVPDEQPPTPRPRRK